MARSAAMAAGAAALVAALLVASPELGSFGGDNAEYCLLARSLRAGEGYRSAWAPGEAPPHALYPPVFRMLVEHYLPGTPNFLFAPALPWLRPWAGILVWGLALAAVLTGLLRRRLLALPETFLVLALAMQCAWPFRDPRFALPLAALLAPLALGQAHGLLARHLPRAANAAATALAVLLLLPNAWVLGTLVLPRAHRERPSEVPGDHRPAALAETWAWSDDEFRRGAPTQAAFLHACDLVREGAIPGLPEGPVMAGNPRVAALLTGRRAVQPPRGGSPDEVAARAREAGVAAVLVPDFGDPYAEALRRWRDARPGDLERLLSLPGGVEVLRVRR